MFLHVIASGSSGNCYLLEGRNSALVLECGVPPGELMRRTSCPISRIAGCLVTHEHGDHAKFAARFADIGLDVYASAGTLRETDAQDFRKRPLLPMEAVRLGEFVVRPFPVHHDAAEPFGYLIEHHEMGTLLFVTDTRQVDYTFRTYNLAHIMVEANYGDDILDGRVLSGSVEGNRARRIRDTHLSLRSACELVRANDNASLQTVVMLHLSDGNSDADRFQSEMQRSVRMADVYVAAPGLRVDLSQNQFETK